MDILVKASDGYVRYIDVAIVEPTGASYMAKMAADRNLRPAQIREKDKQDDFNSFATEVHPDLFVPFVFESSGRPGKCALDFLCASGIPDGVRCRLLEHISVTLARFGGKMISRLRRGLGG